MGDQKSPIKLPKNYSFDIKDENCVIHTVTSVLLNVGGNTLRAI